MRANNQVFRLGKGIFWKYKLKICDCLKKGHIFTFMFQFDVGMIFEKGHIGATALFFT